MIREAAQRGAKIVCLQELFYGPYFCTEQDRRSGTRRPNTFPTVRRRG